MATLSVYSYLFLSLFAHQYLEPSPLYLDKDTFHTLKISFSDSDTFLRHTPDIYIPVFAILEFICYMGWIKVAETLLNPWGDDDEDFQINFLIDRNFRVGCNLGAMLSMTLRRFFIAIAHNFFFRAEIF